jgi:hypothetical protein
MRGEVAARQQIDLAVILNVDERIRCFDTTFEVPASSRRGSLASVRLI